MGFTPIRMFFWSFEAYGLLVGRIKRSSVLFLGAWWGTENICSFGACWVLQDLLLLVVEISHRLYNRVALASVSLQLRCVVSAEAQTEDHFLVLLSSWTEKHQNIPCRATGVYSAFANSRPLQTDTFLFPLVHSHNILLTSNKFQ